MTATHTISTLGNQGDNRPSSGPEDARTFTGGTLSAFFVVVQPHTGKISVERKYSIKILN